MSNKSHTVFLRGGLGNQFFQWIYALHLQEQGCVVTLDDSFVRKIADNQAIGMVELHKVFRDLHMPISGHVRYIKRAEPLFVRLAYATGILHIEGRAEMLPRRTRLHYGYYQSPVYCTEAVSRRVINSVRPEFYPKAYPTFPKNLRTKKYIAIHIRGGDYTQVDYNFSEIGLLAPVYYAHAIASANAGLPIVVVSDDDLRARRVVGALALRGCEVFHLTDLSSSASDAMLALSVMLSADYLICANSSFSAMGGYLNPDAWIGGPAPWFRGGALSVTSPAKPHWHSVASTFEAEHEK
jgi:hypothetical protein